MALDLVTQLYIDGAWTTKAGYSERGGWDFEIGPPADTELRPSRIGVTLADDDLELDPSNVQSSLYGKIGRNTPVRLRINGVSLSRAEAVSWAPESTMEHEPAGIGQGSVQGVSFITLGAEGLLRRIATWEDVVESPISLFLAGQPGLVGWAGLEGPSTSERLDQRVTGAPLGRFSSGATLGGDGPPGTQGALRMGSGSNFRSTFKRSTATGWEVCWSQILNATPADGTYREVFAVFDSAGNEYRLEANNTAYQLRVLPSDGGAALLTLGAGFYGFNPPTEWTRFVMRVTKVNPSTNEVELYGYGLNDDFANYVNGTYALTATYAPAHAGAAANAHSSDARYSHITASTDTNGYQFSTSAFAAFSSFPYEKTTNRFARILAAQGVQAYVGGDTTRAVPIGPQPSGTVMDIIKECLLTEGGIMYDEPTDIAVMFRTRQDIAARTDDVALALTKSQIQYPLKKIIDPVGIANRVNVTNADGTRAVAELESGPISVLAPPDGIGLTKADLDINQANLDTLTDRAEYELARRTVDRPRYTQVRVDLFANPSLADTVTAMRPGDWISIDDLEPDTVYLRVISIARSGDAVRDTVTFNCQPAEPFQTAIIDEAGHRKGSRSTTLNADITSTATTIVLSTANPVEVWDTAGDYEIMLTGERIGVPAAGMGAVSGSGPYLQTITGAVRSVNGVVKAHVASETINVADPVRIGL